MRPELPSGTVTFLFTDVEGSTRLLHALGAEAYTDVLGEHRRLLRQAFADHDGVEVDTQGDAFFVAFPTAPGALAAALQAREALTTGPIRVRIGLHTGTPHLAEEGYVGADVHRAARIAAAGHGGQILVSTATAALLDASDLRDLGAHRLKDLSAPERIYQVGSEEHPPLKTFSSANVPRPATPLVGREREMRDVVARIRQGSRLVTLTGPGGTGKTRLALEVAIELAPDHAGGVFWVPLAALDDPALVTAEIGRVVGASDGLVEHIADRELLMVLDNFEQVVAAGAELATLLEDCPNLAVLVTSRELLRVRGEDEVPVPPLSNNEAVSLFAARAGSTDPLVGELCRRLDNLPLAVELAAARARVLSPAQILERLPRRLDLFRGGRDADARQQTLRAAIEWSHGLLAPEEAELFARLAVFRGGWTLEAAEEVADADLDTLASLVDKSLVARSGERFRMLETIRAFAEERLEDSKRADALRDRHLAHFLALAERWYADMFAAESTWLPVLDAETDNIRAALDWAHDEGRNDEIRLIGAIAPLWQVRGQQLEARRRLVAAVQRHTGADAARARALTHLGEIDDDLAPVEEALAIWRGFDDRAGEARALETMGWINDALGDYRAAEAAYEESLAIQASIGAPAVEGLSARAGLCHVLVARSETERAFTVAGEVVTLAQQHHTVRMEQLGLHFLADCALIEGDWFEAETRYRRALATARNADLVKRMADELLGVAMARAGAGDPAEALRIAAAAYAKHREIGSVSDAWWRSMQETLLGPPRETLPAEEVEAAETEGLAMPFNAVIDELLVTERA